MKSRATPRFWAAYHVMPPDVRDAAQKAYRLFRENPKHPGLQFKQVHALPVLVLDQAPNPRAHAQQATDEEGFVHT